MIATFFALAALSPSLVSLHRDNQRQSKNANLKTAGKNLIAYLESMLVIFYSCFGWLRKPRLFMVVWCEHKSSI